MSKKNDIASGNGCNRDQSGTSTTSSKGCFTDLDGWNEIVCEYVIQSPLNLKLIICAVKEFLIATLDEPPVPNCT